MKSIDDKIKHLIQSSEKEIPREVEESFTRKLKEQTARSIPTRKGIRYLNRIVLVSAACLLIASMVFLLQFLRTPSKFKNSEIILQSAKIKGQTAQIIVFKEQNPELTVVWVEYQKGT